MSFKHKKNFLLTGFLGLLFCFNLVATILATAITTPPPSAGDSPTTFNLIVQGGSVSQAGPNDPKKLAMVSCQANFKARQEDSNLLKFEGLGTSLSSLQEMVDRSDPASIASSPFETLIGVFPQTLTKENLKYIISNFGKTIPVITFSPGTGTPINGDLLTNKAETECAKFVMIPVSPTEWRGFQLYNDSNTTGRHGYYLQFNINPGASSSVSSVGLLSYYERTDQPAFSQRQDSIAVAGSPTIDPGNDVAVGTINAVWRDASQIVIGGGQYDSEIYKKVTWDNQNYYFLTDVSKSSPSNQSARGNMVVGGGNKYCATPLDTQNQDKCNLSLNCVPFFYVSNNNFSFRAEYTKDNADLGQLQSAIDKLGNARVTYYNYNSNGCGAQNTSGIPASMASTNDATNWFYYSKKNDAFISVFRDGASNEKLYIGEYTKKANGIYVGGLNGCSGQIQAVPEQFAFKVQWSFFDKTCQIKYGTVTVWAIANEDAFSGILQDQEAAAAVINENAASPKLKCATSIINPLSWFICPLVAGAQAMIGALDDDINSLLTVDTLRIFCTTASSTCSSDQVRTGKAYFTAWNTFRIFGLALIVIAGLVTIIAQAAGFEFLDAYTIRKVLPRLIIAVIGISLSWYILEFLVNFANDTGNAMRSLIYAPFHSFGAVKLGGGSVFSLGLVGGAAALALGIFGLLSLAVTGALAVLIGFAVLIIRQLVVIFLLVLAPFAIACAILPNTAKAWKFWSDTLLKALLLFPIIAGFIAVGRVFAVTSAATNNTVYQLVAFVAYFAPYFLITFAFRLAGGAIATIGGIANDRSRGAFDRLRKYRAAKTQHNMHAMAIGDRFKNEGMPVLGAAAKAFNVTTRGLANVPSAGLNPREMRRRFKAGGGERDFSLAEEAIEKNKSFQAMMNNDDYHDMVDDTARAFDESTGQWVTGSLHDESKQAAFLRARGYGAEDAQAGVAVVRRARRSMSENAFKMASVMANGTTGTSWKAENGGAAAMGRSILWASGGDQNTTARILARVRNGATQQRRFDLAGGSFNQQLITTLQQRNRGADFDTEVNEQLSRNALEGQGGGAIAAGRIQSVRALAPQIRTNLEEAFAGGDDAAIQELAVLAGRYDVMGQVAPENAKILKDEVMSREGIRIDSLSPKLQERFASIISSPRTGGKVGPRGAITYQEAIEAMRGDSTFQELRREYQNATYASAAQAQQAAAAAAAQAGGFQPPGPQIPGQGGQF
ncbi:MAG TPA: hypothetical protein VLG37_03715 [Candidatus Saccharimonadales bacterium]|nr:hypothetical protein [Candidatus Saccharimonadales bacterium]